MIPAMNLIAWSKVAPWGEQRQVEQDLIISRAIVELFSDPFLAKQLRFRGGTALNKLHFPRPMRYSEDIDLVRTAAGPIGPVLNRVRGVLEPWLGHADFDQSPVAPKLRFRAYSEDGVSSAPLRLKVEINTREIDSYDSPRHISYGVENPWFSGEVGVHTFSREEMLATKLRALLQRDRGRDLFDLSHALAVFEQLGRRRTVEHFLRYLERDNASISRAQAEQRMFAKLRRSGRLAAEIRPLLAAEDAERLTEKAVDAAFAAVFSNFVVKIPGEPWARTEEFTERFGLSIASHPVRARARGASAEL